MKLRKRRAVGGLISLIGIIVVFGIVSVAYLELSSSQTKLISTSLVANQKISDKNNARLNFTDPTVVENSYDLPIENIGSDTITIHSYIVSNSTHHVIGTGEITIPINAGGKAIVSTNTLNSSPTEPSDFIMIVTDLGKKCVIPADVSYRIC